MTPLHGKTVRSFQRRSLNQCPERRQCWRCPINPLRSNLSAATAVPCSSVARKVNFLLSRGPLQTPGTSTIRRPPDPVLFARLINA